LRDGQLKYCSRYYWWMIIKGYEANPYEIEANARLCRREYFRRNSSTSSAR
jgi:hypothetical protein